jgi:hypothetical protein
MQEALEKWMCCKLLLLTSLSIDVPSVLFSALSPCSEVREATLIVELEATVDMRTYASSDL